MAASSTSPSPSPSTPAPSAPSSRPEFKKACQYGPLCRNKNTEPHSNMFDHRDPCSNPSTCIDPECLFAHTIMPCKFFERGACKAHGCKYRHVIMKSFVSQPKELLAFQIPTNIDAMKMAQILKKAATGSNEAITFPPNIFSLQVEPSITDMLPSISESASFARDPVPPRPPGYSSIPRPRSLLESLPATESVMLDIERIKRDAKSGVLDMLQKDRAVLMVELDKLEREVEEIMTIESVRGFLDPPLQARLEELVKNMEQVFNDIENIKRAQHIYF